jgi:predicted dienelactone hydrolase
MMQKHSRGLLLIGLLMAASAVAAEPPSRPGTNAPELARLGTHAVGVKTITLVDRNQVDIVGWDPKSGAAPKHDRNLTVEIWYPATPAKGAVPETYSASMESEPPAPPAAFKIQGIAVRGAPPEAGRFPLVIVAHGYGNTPVAMSWLTENLASKGYVGAAIHHEDHYFNPAGFAEALLRRPLDIAFVTRELQRTLGEAGSVDPSRTALIGYSMGGYGVLTAGGGVLDPSSPIAGIVPGGILVPYMRGGASIDAMHPPGVKAVVAISAAGGALSAWGANGLEGITTPLLLISGDHDRTVDYTSGARAFFDAAKQSNRYLLTFHNGGHALGLGPAPDEMKQHLWDEDWFEDPVWRKERLIGINLHFITAFLDRYVKGDASRSAYLDGLIVESSQGEWPTAPKETPWAAYSPGGEGITLWKGFPRRHAEGLSLMHQEAAAAK